MIKEFDFIEWLKVDEYISTLLLVDLTIITRWLSYLCIFALCINYRQILFSKEQRQKYDDWIQSHHKLIFNLHGISTYIVFRIFEGSSHQSNYDENESSSLLLKWKDNEVLFNIFVILLGWLLWELGSTYPSNLIFLIGMHHLGTLVALFYQFHEDPIIASRNTHLFSWLWLSHSFGFIQNILGKLFRMHVEGKKCPAFDRMREIYAAITVYFLYCYFFAESQPGFGWNYQTIGISIMLLGRYFFGNNYQNVEFFRRVEVPGTIVIYSSIFCNYNIYWGIGLTICLYVGYFTLSVFLKLTENCPKKWDPSHPRINEVLSQFENNFIAKSPDGIMAGIEDNPWKNVETMKKFRKTKPERYVKYPIIMAVAENDITKLEKLLSAEDSNIHIRMSDWYDTTAGMWATHLGRVKCVIMLLRAGLNPWEGKQGESVWSIAKSEKITPLLELKETIQPIVLELFPPDNEINDNSVLSFWRRTKNKFL